MRRTATFLAAAFAVTLAASAAHAGSKVMATAPAQRSYPTTQDMRCNIVNLNKTSKPVTIEAVDYSGTIVSAGGPYNLMPNQAVSFLVSGDFGQAAYCRFTVDGSTKKYRAVATYNDATSYTTVHAAQ